MTPIASAETVAANPESLESQIVDAAGAGDGKLEAMMFVAGTSGNTGNLELDANKAELLTQYNILVKQQEPNDSPANTSNSIR